METLGITDYVDYRDFLKARWEDLRLQDKTMSYRAFSARAGFGSPNYLHLVINKKRHISEDSAERFGAVLGLTRTETECLKLAVIHAKVTHPQVREFCLAQMKILSS